MQINYVTVTDIPSNNANSLQIIQMCNAMALNGNKVNLIIPNLGKSEKTVKEFYGIKSDFKIIKIGNRKNMISKYQNILIPVRLVLKCLFIKSDKIITRNLLISLIFIILRKKHIIEIHDDLRTSGKILSKVFKKLKLLNSTSIEKIIFITKSLKNFIISNYDYKNNNFKILPDSTSIFNSTSNNWAKKNLNIGYFGSIYKSRGIATILKLSKFDQKNIYYIYGGSNSFVNKLKRKTFNKNLILCSQIPYNKIKDEILKMDILLLPYANKVTTTGDIGNIIDFMSPMKMFDYLGSSKVIISANIPVLREVLTHKHNCIFIDNYLNVNSWLKEIRKISSDYAKYSILRKNALKTVTKFTWCDRAKQIIE